jgi:protein-L-isoaspartate(D-aspartate) O-methyltransferase
MVSLVAKVLCLVLLFIQMLAAAGIAQADSPKQYKMQREAMVYYQIEKRGVKDQRVLEAMRHVPRHQFVPKSEMSSAYKDHPLPIGYGQTISQPFIVAYMCELAQLEQTDRVLEVGTGSAYHAAVIAQLVDKVYSIEIISELATRARTVIAELGYKNINIRHADGYFGWKEEAPFDAIIVTAAADHIPPSLIRQLAEGGRMVIPVGHVFFTQKLILAEKRNGKMYARDIIPVRFVPLTGNH